MKHKLFFLAITIMMAVSAHLSAEDIYDDYLVYSTSGTTAKVIGSYTGINIGKIKIPESITYNGNTYSVTSIGGSAFSFHSNITSITIPNSITDIGLSAFNGCTANLIVNCNIGNASDSYYGWFAGSECTSVEIGEGVTSIGDYAFHWCYKLTSITIPSGVTSIGVGAFEACCELVSITVREGNSVYDSRNNCNAIIETGTNTLIAGCKNTIIPNSVTSIGDYAFYKSSGLTSITIPNSVTSIGQEAFWYCDGLTSITIPNSVINIGKNAFFCCTGKLIVNCNIGDATSFSNGWFYNSDFSNIEIGEGVTTIGDEAFNSCSSLSEITIPNSITSIGKNAFDFCTGKLIVNCNIGDATSPSNGWFAGSKFNSVEIGEEVTTIGDYAFFWCSSLSEIIIPSSVIHIGKSAFVGCTGKLIVNCNIGDATTSNGWFWSADFSNIEIGEGVTTIGDYAFSSCYRLSEITIPNSVTNIGKDAFNYCKSLATIIIPNSVSSIGDYAFYGCESLAAITIPNSISSIGYQAFENCTSIKDVNVNISSWSSNTILYSYMPSDADWKYYVNNEELFDVIIPDSVTSIGDRILYKDNNITSITIPNSITSIGKEAFSGCAGKLIVNCNIGDASSYERGWFYNSKFSSVEIGEDVTRIGNYAFYGCSSFSEITLPNTVNSIGTDAFKNTGITNVYIGITDWSHDFTIFSSLPKDANWNYCDNNEVLTDVIIPDSVTSIGSRILYNGKNINSITVPNSVKTIGDGAFTACTSLKSISIPDGVTSIGSIAFSGCSSLSSIIIPEGIATIGNYTFYNCSNLSEIIIPSSLTSIGNSAFTGCKGIVSLTCLADTPPIAYAYTFGSVDKSLCTLYVKKNTASLYAAATGWSAFTNIIEIDDQNMDINQILADPSTETIYDLSGNRAQQMQQGRTYIRNGKKILVK